MHHYLHRHTYANSSVKLVCKDILKQISERIKWIGENKQDALFQRESLQDSISKADEIFFLGFGFDINNLYNLGIVNKEHQIEEKIFKDRQSMMKIIVSGGNAKIISTLKNIFRIHKQEIIEGVYHLKNEQFKLEMYISKEHLPKALDSDL